MTDTASARKPVFGTPSARAEAQNALKAKRAWAAANLRREFPDAEYWADLARMRGLRLPSWHIAPTTGAIRRWLGAIDRSVEWFREWQGGGTLSSFARLNPDWPMRALAGVLLEELEAMQ